MNVYAFNELGEHAKKHAYEQFVELTEINDWEFLQNGDMY